MTMTHVFDDSSPDFKFTGDWWTGGVWNASDGQSGTLSGTNNLTGYASFFPIAATGLRYFGMKRSRGGRYGICVDCDPNNATYTMIDAWDPSDSGSNTPTLLWSQTFASPSIHVITLANHYDSRGTPMGKSQLTIDRFELDVPDASQNVDTSTLSTQRPNFGTISSSPTSPTSSVSGTQHSSYQTTISSPTGSLSAVDTSKAPPIGGIIGGCLGGIFSIGTLIFLIFRLRSKRHTASLVTLARPFQLPETPTARLGWPIHDSVIKSRRGSHEGPQVLTSSPPLSRAPTSGNAAASPYSSVISSNRRRALDGGPIHPEQIDDENETLPPDYAEVINARRPH